MTRIYTPDYIKSLQAKLKGHIDDDIDVKETPTPNRVLNEQEFLNQYSHYYAQILILEAEQDTKTGDIKYFPKLVYGKKQDIQNKYKLENSFFPSSGVKVDKNFLSTDTKNPIEKEIKLSTYSTVRFLLQCRKLSQIFTSTWLDPQNLPEKEKLTIPLTKQILDSYNIVPETYWLKTPEENLAPETRLSDLQLEKKVISVQETEPKYSSFLVSPESLGYSSIALGLLLSGQAYCQDKNGQWQRICESIFSTYEIVWEYCLDLSWDTFYATRVDLSQSGEKPKPPYTKVTLCYPPRPSEFNLTQKQIQDWVTAAEESSDNNLFPFYPMTDSTEWKEHELNFVVPPYPYIPLSCV